MVCNYYWLNGLLATGGLRESVYPWDDVLSRFVIAAFGFSSRGGLLICILLHSSTLLVLPITTLLDSDDSTICILIVECNISVFCEWESFEQKELEISSSASRVV
jgi:hypothetical protein